MPWLASDIVGSPARGPLTFLRLPALPWISQVLWITTDFGIPSSLRRAKVVRETAVLAASILVLSPPELVTFNVSARHNGYIHLTQRGPPYLLSDRAGTLDQLPLGVAVCGAHLEGPCLLHQEDTAMAKVLHTCANLESNLQRQSQEREGP